MDQNVSNYFLGPFLMVSFGWSLPKPDLHKQNSTKPKPHILMSIQSRVLLIQHLLVEINISKVFNFNTSLVVFPWTCKLLLSDGKHPVQSRWSCAGHRLWLGKVVDGWREDKNCVWNIAVHG